jgi:hypothetical protein
MDILKVDIAPVEVFGRVLEFWRVLINGREITARAHPFSAGDGRVVLDECDNCFHCGLANTLVRRCGPNVLWFAADERAARLRLDEFFLFTPTNYREVTRDGCIEELPSLTSDDLSRLLRRQDVPGWLEGLYTTPSLASDPSGRLLLQLLADFTESKKLKVASQPPSHTQVCVGLERTGIPESSLEVGYAGSIPAIRLGSLPNFPTWLTSPAAEPIASHILSHTLPQTND